MKFHNAVANCGCLCRLGEWGVLCKTLKTSQCQGRKDTSALEMSHWKHIGYIYQSRKHYRVNNISLTLTSHPKVRSTNIFFPGICCHNKENKAFGLPAVTFCTYSVRIMTPKYTSPCTNQFNCSRKEGRSRQTAAKRLCGFGEVAQHLWVLVFSLDELDDIQEPSAISFNCLKNSWHHKDTVLEGAMLQEIETSRCSIWRCYWWNVLVPRKFIKWSNNTVDPENRKSS